MAMDLKDVWQAQKERADKLDWRPLAKGAGFVQGSCPIEDHAVTVQGLRFRATAHICAADKDVPFQTGHHRQNKIRRGLCSLRLAFSERSRKQGDRPASVQQVPKSAPRMGC